jgi:hypothetical protein
VDGECEGDGDEEMIEINKTVDDAAAEATDSKLNKTLLYENWLEDYEKEKKKQQLKNAKKRKRSENSSPSNKRSNKSRSPTPVSSKGTEGGLQFDISKVQSRKASVKNSEESKNNTSSQMVTDSEEERKEMEKIKSDIIQYLAVKDEPLTIMQISYGTKYAKQYCDEAINALI